jgi:hypothetical protein
MFYQRHSPLYSRPNPPGVERVCFVRCPEIDASGARCNGLVCIVFEAHEKTCNVPRAGVYRRTEWSARCKKCRQEGSGAYMRLSSADPLEKVLSRDPRGALPSVYS